MFLCHKEVNDILNVCVVLSFVLKVKWPCVVDIKISVVYLSLMALFSPTNQDVDKLVCRCVSIGMLTELRQ